jgi:hypothetical protein
MLLDVTIMAVFLLFGNIAFRRFDPHLPWWKRVLKTTLILAATALISHYFGHRGVIVAFAIAMLPVVYIHAIWLPRHGVNGWTAEPRDKYYALRGWPRPDR